MKLLTIAGTCLMFSALFACGGASGGGDVSATSGDELNTSAKELSCAADSGDTKLALVAIKDGKFALVALKRAGDVYAVSGTNGAVTTSSSGRTWTGGGASLKLGKDLKGTWERDGKSTKVTCNPSTSGDAASYRAANALTDYASEIDGLAESVVGESNDPAPKPYTVYAVATSDRDSLSLGEKVNDSQGAIPGSDDAESRLDEDDSNQGAMSAAYALGGGDDYAEWFQGASDGISLVGDLKPALKDGTHAGFVARQKVTALASLVDSTKPSAVEITVGAWTFYLPNAFPKK